MVIIVGTYPMKYAHNLVVICSNAITLSVLLVTYIFIFYLTFGLNGLGKDNRKMRQDFVILWFCATYIG